jgi:hypothetical protein
MMTVEQLRNASGGQLIEGRGALMVETERATPLQVRPWQSASDAAIFIVVMNPIFETNTDPL